MIIAFIILIITIIETDGMILDKGENVDISCALNIILII